MKEIKQHYKPKEFAQAVGVSVKTLQRWDNDGTLIADRTPGGRRQYTPRHFIELKKKIPDSRMDKEVQTANLWLSPYPLKNIINATACGSNAPAEALIPVITPVSLNKTAVKADFAVYGEFRDHHVTIAPVSAVVDPYAGPSELLEGLLFRIGTENIKIPFFVRGNRTPYYVNQNGRISNQIYSTDTEGTYGNLSVLFNTITDERGLSIIQFIYAEPGSVMVFMDNVFREQHEKAHIMETLIAFDEYLTKHHAVGNAIEQL